MKTELTYKGYKAVVTYEESDKAFYGRLINIKDTVIFELEKLEDAEKVFHEVVDDYIDMKRRLESGELK